MTLLLLLSIMIPLGIGFLWVSLFWPIPITWHSNGLLPAFFAVGIGIGMSSCLYFLWLLGMGPARRGFIIMELLVFIIPMVVFWCNGKKRKAISTHDLQGEPISVGEYGGILAFVFYVALAFSLLSFIVITLKHPHGGWDAWMIWNLRARFIFRAGDQWREAFSPLVQWWTHPDYPLLLPGMIARCWSFMNDETIVVPIVLSMLFTFSVVGLLFSSLSILRNYHQGFLAGIAALSVPFLVKQGASQLADVPLGFYMLATIVLICLQYRSPDAFSGLSFLSGLMAGFSAWTKNEGLLFVASLLVVRFFSILFVKGRKSYLKQLLFFMIGLVPILILIVYFKVSLAPANDLVSYQALLTAGRRLFNYDRYLQISKEFVSGIIHFGEGVITPLPVLIVYLFCVGIRRDKRDWFIINTILAILGLIFVGYFGVYVVSPHDLEWHVFRSLDRLLLQLWPSFIFIYFMVGNTPDQARAKG